MNILVLSNAFFPDRIGGITKSLFSEVKELALRGHRIVVVTRKIKPGLPLQEYFHDYHLYRYACPSEETFFYRLYPFFSIKKLPKLIDRLHKKYHFDAAYVHDVFQAVGLSRCVNHIPYIFVYHAPLSLEIKIEAAKGKYGWKKIFVSLAHRWIYNKERQALLEACAVIVRSRFIRNQMNKLYRGMFDKKVTRIPLGVDLEKFSFVENQKYARNEINFPLDQPVLLTVRRLTARTGIENLIKSITRTIKYFPDVLLIIGGKGYLEDKLKNMIKKSGLGKNVQMAGFIPEEKLYLYYQAADLFILPTVELEGFGLSTIESLACGTPVIATPVGANSEVLAPLDKNLICEDASPDSISQKTIGWLKNERETKYRKKCRHYCESFFNIKKVASQIEQTLRCKKRSMKDSRK